MNAFTDVALAVLLVSLAWFVGVLIALPRLTRAKPRHVCREVRVPMRALVDNSAVIEKSEDIETNELVYRFRWNAP